ncbi:glycosyltransferase family 2 protein [Candidatus Bathyarchaeota archaeon]|nr:glycosyltransferase family 2 protein [Candidatus Bathyarchaeota archaeon]
MISKISILIPVYKESKLLPDILNKLLNQKIEKEIFIIIDEPSEYSLKISNEFHEKAKFIINNERIGKANALNKVAKSASSEILLFLDADVEVPEDEHFLNKILREMEKADIIDVKKEVVKDSFLAKMSYYEYVSFNICSWLMGKFVKKTPAINGAAFAIKKSVFDKLGGFRKVISEDLDIAIRAFLNECKFAYVKEANVYNHVHSSWRKWMIQRRRWSIGAALWFKEWFKELLRRCFKKPQVFIPALFLLFPSSTILIINIFSLNLPVYTLTSAPFHFISIISLFLTVNFNFMLPILLLIHIGLNVLQNFSASIIAFLAFSSLFFILSRRLGFKFKLHEFLIYYFIYSFLSLLIMIAALIKVFIFNKKDEKLDWKV